MEKNTQTLNSIQDSFLNHIRKDRIPVTIYLMSGVKLTGKIRSFDKYCVVIDAGSQEQLIFKHAISTVCITRMGGGRDSYHPRTDREHTEHTEQIAAE